jgi:signal peptidase
LTKGDNNAADDLVLYNGASWMRRSNIVGKVQGCVPLPAAPRPCCLRPLMLTVPPGRQVHALRRVSRVCVVCSPSAYPRSLPSYVTIALNDYPKLKYLLLGGLGLSLLLQKE